jgi:ATP-dependent Clp protease ATP-binding subunit ClpB
MNKFDAIVEGALSIAQSEAHKRKNTEIYPEHLVFGLIQNPQSYSSRALKKYLKDLEKLIEAIPTSNRYPSS